jgi:hypothetical protein
MNNYFKKKFFNFWVGWLAMINPSTSTISELSQVFLHSLMWGRLMMCDCDDAIILSFF